MSNQTDLYNALTATTVLNLKVKEESDELCTAPLTISNPRLATFLVFAFCIPLFIAMVAAIALGMQDDYYNTSLEM